MCCTAFWPEAHWEDYYEEGDELAPPSLVPTVVAYDTGNALGEDALDEHQRETIHGRADASVVSPPARASRGKHIRPFKVRQQQPLPTVVYPKRVADSHLRGY